MNPTMRMMFLSQGKIYYRVIVFKISIWRHPRISPTRDSPKKARSKDPSTPMKVQKSVQRQLIFDTAVYVQLFNCLIQWPDLFYFRSNVGKKAASKEDKEKAQLATSSTSPSKAILP
jgi:hypothetical protein